MGRLVSLLFLVLLPLSPCRAAPEPRVSRNVSTEMEALRAYESGRVSNLMKSPDGQSIILEDMVVFEDDAPGAGWSQKGPFTEEVRVGVLAKKRLFVADPTAREAHAVLFMEPLNPEKELQAPYYLLVNGHRIEGNPVPSHEGNWHWVRIPLDFLEPGENEIVVGCDAPSGEGYRLLIAREDEYEAGGGFWTYEGNTSQICAGLVAPPTQEGKPGFERIRVGERSSKSTDGGTTWITRALGGSNDVVGEYSIRLNLRRYKANGTIESPPIDLWQGIEGHTRIIPQCQVDGLVLAVTGEAPAESDIRWLLRFGDTPNLMSRSWTDYIPIEATATARAHIADISGRFIQWKADLKSNNPFSTATVRGVRVDRILSFTPPAENTFYVWDYQNSRLRVPSIPFAWEDFSHPELAAIRSRLDLDRLLEGATGDFDRINRVRHHISTLWKHELPEPDYPAWNGLEILDRKERMGAGGMCVQFSALFLQALQSLGYAARHVNLFFHDTVEVYVDELGKWVLVDPESVFDSYQFSAEDGEPLSALDQHKHFLDTYGFAKERPINWMDPNPWGWPGGDGSSKPQALGFSTFTDWINNPENPPPLHRLAGFLRIFPRNNFLSHPNPMPVNHGLRYHWPWNGYVNWYDESTPRKLQYSLHSDREADFYPTMNRVQYTATWGEAVGTIDIDLLTYTPGFDSFEIRQGNGEWVESPPRWTWSLAPSAVNTVEVRTRNQAGHTGKPSRLQVVWHYREPFRPKKEGGSE